MGASQGVRRLRSVLRGRGKHESCAQSYHVLQGKIEETLPPYPEIYHRETPPEVDMDYIARPDEIRENAKISLMQFEGNECLRYLREAVRELTDTQADRLHIRNILGYETALRTAIAENDLITMRR